MLTKISRLYSKVNFQNSLKSLGLKTQTFSKYWLNQPKRSFSYMNDDDKHKYTQKAYQKKLESEFKRNIEDQAEQFVFKKVYTIHDYYKILESPQNSSVDFIKQQYRKLAFQYHPDRLNDLDNS